MRLNNNRYRRSFEQYSAHFKKEWKVYALICAVSFLISMFIVSWFYQVLGHTNGTLEHYHIINPIFIIYYGLIKAGGFTVLIGILIAFAASYYKFYITMVDYEYDPRGFAISPRGTYGTNRVMSDAEKDSFLEKTTIDKTDKNIIYKDEDGFVYVLRNPAVLGPHKFVCGVSGSRKTSCVFLPDIMQMIRRGESGICTDPKGELRSLTYKMAKKHNYIVRELNLINPILSDGCDFMKLVETYGDARTFTEVIMMNTSGDAAHNEDFWAKGERAAICFGILYVHEADEYKGRRTFKNVFEFLKNDLDTLNAKADQLPEGSNAKNQWRIFQTTPDNSKGGVMTGVTTRLQILNDPAIAQITGRDEIDMTMPGQRPCMYYVIVSDQDSSNNVITSIFFSFLFIKLVGMADRRLDQKLPVAVNFLLDEMPNVCKIPEFPKKLSTIRSRNMRCTICAQDVGQMQGMFPGATWANVISNCDTQIMLGCNDPEITGKFWSNAYGEMTIIVETEKEAGERFNPININNERGVSVGDGKRQVFTVGEICGLPIDYSLIRFRGHNVLKELKFPYFEHPMYEEIEDENYFQHKPLWWQDVAKEMEDCENPMEYEWFVQGISNLDQLNKEMEQQLAEKKAREAEVAKKTKAQRVANGAVEKDESKKDPKVMVILAKRKVKEVLASLHGKSEWHGTVTETSDTNMQKAVDAFDGQTGQEERTYTDAYLAGNDDDELSGAGNMEKSRKPVQVKEATVRKPQQQQDDAAEPLQSDRVQRKTLKNIEKNFSQAKEKEEEEIKPANKRKFTDSISNIVNTKPTGKSQKTSGEPEPASAEPAEPEEKMGHPDYDDDYAGFQSHMAWSDPYDDMEPDIPEPEFDEPDIPESAMDDLPGQEETDRLTAPAAEEETSHPYDNIMDKLMKSQEKQKKRQEGINKKKTGKTRGL